MCPVPGHGTTSWLPPFLHRYLHYVAAVVEMAVEGVSVEDKELFDLVELDGPSFETVQRWNVELTSIPLRERLLRLLPSDWLPTREDNCSAVVKHLPDKNCRTVYGVRLVSGKRGCQTPALPKIWSVSTRQFVGIARPAGTGFANLLRQINERTLA